MWRRLFVFSFYFSSFSLVNSNTNKDHSITVPVIRSSSKNIFFEEQFQDNTTWIRWIQSQARKEGVENRISKYDGQWAFENPESSMYKNDYGLVLKSKEKHHAISVHLYKLFDFSSKSLIVQYEVKFQNNPECGGAYIKLLSYNETYPDLNQVTDKTPFTIMFGPDMCGAEYKYHFIIRFRNPITGNYSEHQAKKPSELLNTYFTDKKTHLYTLILSDDNNFQMFIDNKLINSGNLLLDMEPSIIPSKEIIDENDRKPDDWDEREKIIDMSAKKPDDWDETAPKEILDKNAKIPNGWLENEPFIVPDPDARKPDEWDDEIDGIWEAPTIDNPLCKIAPGCGKWTPPMIPNPAYKGPWSPPLIDNPNHRGKWEPRLIANPNYFEETHLYRLTPIGSLALELWSLVDGIVFDNFLITSDQSIARQYADQLWDPKSVLEGKPSSPSPPPPSSSSKSILDTIANTTKKHPWLWAVYLALVILPMLITIKIYYWYENRSAKSKSNLRNRKKHDDYTDDDEEDEDEEIENDKHNKKSKINRKYTVQRRSTARQSRRRIRNE